MKIAVSPRVRGFESDVWYWTLACAGPYRFAVISLITVASYVPYEWDRQVETGKSCTELWKVRARLCDSLQLSPAELLEDMA